LTVQQLLADARKLSTRLKDHDQSADQLITRSHEVLKEVEAMRQYQENLDNLNEIAHNRPRAHLVLGIQQENRHIRSLQQENKELRAALEEHQSALELIMSKYREHVTGMIKCSMKIGYSPEPNKQLIQEKIEKVYEMAAVMQEAVRRDEKKDVENQELITRLFIENKGLREILGISQRSNRTPAPARKPTNHDQGVQTEETVPPTSSGVGMDLAVTLPMPAPTTRANRLSSGSTATVGGGGVDCESGTKPVTPENVDKDVDSRLSASPVDPSSSASASESDETSDDDSVKYDTIKLSRRKTVLPASIQADASVLANTVNFALEDSVQLSNQINNNPTTMKDVPSIEQPSPTLLSDIGVKVYTASDGLTDQQNTFCEKQKGDQSPQVDASETHPNPSSQQPATSTTTNASLSSPSSQRRAGAVADSPCVVIPDKPDAILKNNTVVNNSSCSITSSNSLPPNAVTNCESILNDIITNSVDTSAR